MLVGFKYFLSFLDFWLIKKKKNHVVMQKSSTKRASLRWRAQIQSDRDCRII